MKEAEIFAALDAARKGLRNCLEEFQAVPMTEPLVGRSFPDVQRAFAVLGDIEQLKDRVPNASHGRLRASLQEILRLNGMVRQLVQEDRDKVSALLQQSQASLHTMDSLGAGREVTTTLDVSA